MASAKQRKIIRLTLRQAKWLETLAPEAPLSKYVALQEKKNPGARDCLFDHGNFSHFVHGDLGCSREVAESVFEVYGTTLGQVEAIRELGAGFRVPNAFRDSDEAALSATEAAAEQFLGHCGALLWDGAFLNADYGAADSIARPAMDEIVLDLIGCVIEHKRQLNRRQKRSVFGELLDYLAETRQDDRWWEWMTALSREQNRDLFKKIRKTPAKNCLFDCVRGNAGGYDENDYDKDGLRSLGKERFDDFAFVVRRINMRINALRARNYKAYEKIKNRISPSSQRAMREKLKVFLRNCFSVAMLYVRPFWKAAENVRNPNKWYFMLCAARLFYDRARWRYYSVIDDDKRSACETYRHIRDLAIKCSRDMASENSTRCRFNYLAATACRYMAECSSDGIWPGETVGEYLDAMPQRGGGRDGVPSRGGHVQPRVYVEDAVHFAKKALDDWESARGCAESQGEYKALAYRFRRNYARILTFAARWWLLHPGRNGSRPDLFEYPRASGVREKLIGPVCNDPSGTGLGYDPDGLQLMNKANYFCSQSICAPVGKEDETGPTITLHGKRLLEYEFHQRVFIEMLAWFFSNEHSGNMLDIALDPACGGGGAKGAGATRSQNAIKEKDARQAMSVFCRMIAIYAHLFLEASNGNGDGTAMAPATAAAAKAWLGKHDFYKGSEDNPFDIASLDKTRQGDLPALDETRFEIICSFMFGTTAQNRVAESGIWKRLGELEAENGVNAKLRTGAAVEVFLEQVWRPAKKALETDLRDSLARIQGRIAEFEEKYAQPEERRANHCEYPPFVMRFDLVAAPGDNPRRVDTIMSHHGLSWDAFGKGPDASRENKAPELAGSDGNDREQGFSLKTADKEGRWTIVEALFGEGLGREELSGILFPRSTEESSGHGSLSQSSAKPAHSKGRNPKASALTQFFNNGKSATEIQKAAETLLSVDPVAGVEYLSAFGEDSNDGNECKTELKAFLNSAMSHMARHSASAECEKILNALSAIAAIAGNLSGESEESEREKKAVRTLWNGIVAYVGSCPRIPFSFLNEIGETLAEAMDASRAFCDREIASLQTVLVSKSAVLWQHAVRNPRKAVESFAIYGKMMGEDMLGKDAVRDFCRSFPVKKQGSVLEEC